MSAPEPVALFDAPQSDHLILEPYLWWGITNMDGQWLQDRGVRVLRHEPEAAWGASGGAWTTRHRSAAKAMLTKWTTGRWDRIPAVSERPCATTSLVAIPTGLPASQVLQLLAVMFAKHEDLRDFLAVARDLALERGQ